MPGDPFQDAIDALQRARLERLVAQANAQGAGLGPATEPGGEVVGQLLPHQLQEVVSHQLASRGPAERAVLTAPADPAAQQAIDAQVAPELRPQSTVGRAARIAARTVPSQAPVVTPLGGREPPVAQPESNPASRRVASESPGARTRRLGRGRSLADQNVVRGVAEATPGGGRSISNEDIDLLRRAVESEDTTQAQEILQRLVPGMTVTLKKNK